MEYYVQKNYDELTQFAVEALEDPYDLKARTYNGWIVSCIPSTSVVEFTVRGFGIGPSTEYEGFYYSPDDVPLGFQGTDVELTEVDDRWQWAEEYGDNWGYTEKIVEHWYWFEAHF